MALLELDYRQHMARAFRERVAASAARQPAALYAMATDVRIANGPGVSAALRVVRARHAVEVRAPVAHEPPPARASLRLASDPARGFMAQLMALCSLPRSSTGTASIECLLVVPFRSQRPAVGGVPGQLSRQNASLAFSVCHSRCLIWSLPVAPRSLVSYSGLWFSLFAW